MKTESHTETWEIQMLTPLHVGDGLTLEPDLDYIPSRLKLHVYDIETVCEAAADIPQAMSGYGTGRFGLSRFIEDHKLKVAPRYCLPVLGQAKPKDIRRFIKDADYRPYLPGSTVKGAARTALWQSLDRSALPHLGSGKSSFGFFSRAVNGVSGKSPHQDFLRPLTLGDSHPQDPQTSLQVEEIKYFNLRHGNRPGWKDFANMKTGEDYKNAHGVFLETLKPGQSLFLPVRLDGPLRIESIRRAASIPLCKPMEALQSVTAAINRHSLAILRAEIEFFEQFGASTEMARRACQDIATHAEQALDAVDHFFIRLAWGGGWRAMTGNWLTDGQLSSVREVKKIGKINVDVFPKTRRLAMKDGVPCLPLGWAVVWRRPSDEFLKHFTALNVNRQKSSTVVQTDHATSTNATVYEKQTSAKSNADRNIQIRLTSFKDRVDKCRNLPGEVDVFLAEIKNQKNIVAKSEMANLLMQKALSLSSFKRAKKTGKRWAVAIVKACLPNNTE